MNIYWAAPLFNTNERMYNEQCVKALESCGFEVFLPQRDAGELTNYTHVDMAKQIRLLDIAAIDECDILIATLEGEAFDPGTVYEIGYAEAKSKPVYILSEDRRHTRLNAMFSECKRFSYLNDLVEELTGK